MSGQASSDGLNSVVSSFAHPFPGPEDSVLEVLTLYCASLSLSRALQLHGDIVARQSPGLSEVLNSWVACRQRTFWDPLLGRLREVCATQRPGSCYLTLIECALRAHFDGMVGSWTFQLTAPTRLRIGPWILPSATSGQIESLRDRGISLRLKSEDGSVHHLNFCQTTDGNSWRVGAATPPLIELPSISFSDSQIVLLPHYLVSERLLPEAPGARFLEVPELAEVAERVRCARDLISKHSPRYINWVDRSLSCLASSNSPKRGSGSHPSFPGLLVMSNDPRPSAIAEMLVHEASHQYFFMATLLGPVDDGSDAQQYYSPLVGRARPIDKLLLSFHALGNMMLLFRNCIASGIDDSGYCRTRLASITSQINQVGEALQKTTSLTQLGKALWEPLSKLLVQTSE